MEPYKCNVENNFGKDLVVWSLNIGIKKNNQEAAEIKEEKESVQL